MKKRHTCQTSDIDSWLQRLYERKLLTERELKMLAKKAKEVFREEGNICPLQSPITVCGDIHGQFFDLIELFRLGGKLPHCNYLFMGDYVDRGLHSVEVISLLLVLKIRYKDKIHLLRGNHECRHVTQVYGFYDECLKKYGNSNAWKCLTDVFDYMPVTALIDNSIFCMHGGLSPNLKMLDELRNIGRIIETPVYGVLSDLVWSDPEEEPGFSPSPRGSGFLFGKDVTEKFCRNNNLSLISRAHQLVFAGYMYMHEHRVVTVFSAPNYIYRSGNLAAIMNIDDSKERTFLKFQAAPQNSECVMPKTEVLYMISNLEERRKSSKRS